MIIVIVVTIIINCKLVYIRWQCAIMQDTTIQYNTSRVQYNKIQYNTKTYIAQNNTHHRK